MIRIIKLDYLRLMRARDDGAVVQDWDEPCHYRISLFRLMGCFKMFDNSMFLHRKWARSLRCLLWISCQSAGWLSLTSGRRSQRWKSTETRKAARKVTAESSLTIRLNISLLLIIDTSSVFLNSNRLVCYLLGKGGEDELWPRYHHPWLQVSRNVEQGNSIKIWKWLKC